MIGPHAMSLHRTTLALRGVLRALDLAQARAGQRLRVAGMVTARQRPGASKGFVFLTLEDETGISRFLHGRGRCPYAEAAAREPITNVEEAPGIDLSRQGHVGT